MSDVAGRFRSGDRLAPPVAPLGRDRLAPPVAPLGRDRLAPAVAPLGRDRHAPPGRDRRRRLAGASGLSLLLHALALALLVLGVVHQHLDDVVQSSDIAVVFDGGAEASRPQTQESRSSHPNSTPDPNQAETVPPGAAPSLPRPATPPPPLQPPSAQQPAPAALPAASLPAPQSPPSVPAAELPELARGPAPLVVPPPATVAPPRPPTAAAVPRPAPRLQRAPANPFASLGAPMNLSLSGHPPPPASEGHLKRGINLSMAPTDQNRNVMTRYAEARRRLGEDWWASFSAFVEAHKYYPLEAARKGEDGQCVLHLVIEKDGTVRSVQVELSSGSERLDSAWVSEFRGAKVPPFPPGTTDEEISFPASMTYILEHG